MTATPVPEGESGTDPLRPLRTVVVEDEPLARRALRRFIAGDERLVLVGEAGDGEAGVALLDGERPDLVFLDVRMPGCSGLELLDRAGYRPAVVFTTAFAEYAVEAFDFEAHDYLLKPFGRRRFQAAVERVLRRLGGADGRPAPPGPGAADRAAGSAPGPTAGKVTGAASTALSRIFARRGDLMVPVKLADVQRVEGADDYAQLVTGEGRHLVFIRLAELEARLDPARFLRVHRQHIVNLDYVTALEEYDERRMLVRLRDGSAVVASREGTRRLRALVR